MLPFTPATSKYGHSDDMHAFPASFGFKGEALSYISDVSLLEIVTKTHWRPNEFCKDGKCLCLGVGTTGFGISRDGLVLMGGRYATSKYCHSYDMHAFPASFGLKGEALSSTSDISLLEIVTKTHGRPNGYCKVFKCKCLHLGIDDCRQDVGKTVIVRDVFYNQPVQRKHMHSKPKESPAFYERVSAKNHPCAFQCLIQFC
ncbi:DNA mismatch repair protein MLH3-like isoform X3 [Solanum dulcamara]|uniref:DNA mismatch repair protein MLH3-like isoform X3 n=1 Tax=Solanum dulcamara TaxID=45834 RepID=UPI0024862C6B|nr:DNA mismatch repair protein MLH3-like isoform X3 [Solanum dulcamara]